MSNKKSLGSSPIGFKSNERSLGFIPKLDDSEKDTPAKKEQISRKRKGKESSHESAKPVKAEKKTVSYYLDTRLIARIKSVAGDKDICYSALVSKLLHGCLSEYDS